jgi:hypothetical protein
MRLSCKILLILLISPLSYSWGQESIFSIPINKKSPQEIFLETDFIRIDNLKAIPEPVMKAFKNFADPDSKNLIASQEERFSATDVILDESLSRRRLIFAGKSKEYCFIYYEIGGMASHMALVLYRYTDSTATLVLPLTTFEELPTISELKRELQEGFNFREHSLKNDGNF